jgi:predicted Zn finger-like uncharacterized protein
MILTCPECATGYNVDDGQVTAEGRAVRCTACGARWTAFPSAPPPLPLELLTPPAAATPGMFATAPRTATASTLPGEDLPRAFRDRAEEERRVRRAAFTGAVWTAGLLAVVVLLGLFILYRSSVVRLWPQTASAYAAIGFPVNPTGLSIEEVRAEPSLEAGHATLDVSGVIRNVVDHDVLAPPLRISLLNGQGRRVAGQIATLANARIPAGEQRRFVTSVFDPPFSATSLQIDFAMGARPTVAPRPGVPATAAPAQAAAPLRGPATSTDAQASAAQVPAT